MRRLLVVVALITACRGEQRAPAQNKTGSAATGSAAAGSVAARSAVPTLPKSEDGEAVMKQLDGDIERASGDPVKLVDLLLERASIRGLVEDYKRALDAGAAAVKAKPDDVVALTALARAQLAAHLFADARKTLDKIKDQRSVEDLVIQLEQSTGNIEAALARRKARMEQFADARAVTLYAATLRESGRASEAIPLISSAAQQLRSNTPQYLAWLLFQWGLLHEDAGSLATARDFYAEAHKRLPAHTEARVHLAIALVGVGDRKRAEEVLGTLTPESHPALLTVAAMMSADPDNVDRATKAWERYVKLLPSAFIDHAARFYLGPGNNSKRALELARQNLEQRDTYGARALVVEAAVAEGDTKRACEAAEPLLTGGMKRERFIAWRAFSKCGRTEDANKLGRELGISGR
jgi:tetratricopeptide (TPR) repeat protein